MTQGFIILRVESGQERHTHSSQLGMLPCASSQLCRSCWFHRVSLDGNLPSCFSAITLTSVPTKTKSKPRAGYTEALWRKPLEKVVEKGCSRV